MDNSKIALRWIRDRVDALDWGYSTFLFGGKKSPIKRTPNKVIVKALEGKCFATKLSLKQLTAHCQGVATFYFTSSVRLPETLVAIDIDCHQSGTLEGASAFAELLKNRFFKNLYYEKSTNGNGVHAYLVVKPENFKDVGFNKTLKLLERWLKIQLVNSGLDAEDVEVKGTSKEISWAGKRQVESYKAGMLCKLPREAIKRFSELSSTTTLTATELLKIVCENPVEIEKEDVVLNKKGSVSGRLIKKATFEALLPLAEEILGEGIKTSGRQKVIVEDVAVFLALLHFFTLNPLKDKSLPWKRFQKFWQSVVDKGDTTRAFDVKRFAAIRNRLSDLGLINWIDETYCQNKATKWEASTELMEVIDKAIDNLNTYNNNISKYPLVGTRFLRQNENQGTGLRPVLKSIWFADRTGELLELMAVAA